MKKVKILTITLAIALISMVAFAGVYVTKQNRMEDKVKSYTYAMDLKGARTITLKVDTSKKTTIKDSEGKEVENSSNLTDEEISEKGYTKEETDYNPSDVLNMENYKKSKEIIEKRLKELKIDNYVTRLNEQTGEIIVEIPENSDTDNIVTNLGTTGKFEILDSETNEVLMDNNDIKLANVVYGSNSSSTTSSGTSIYLNIEFNKEGTKKLEDISGKYVKTSNETNTENTSESTDTSNSSEKKITMKIDDEEIMSTSFDEVIKTGRLQLSIGSSSTDQKTLQTYVEQANNMATVLDTGKTPVKYTVDENHYVLSDITENELKTVEYAIMGIVLISLIVLVVRYKLNGLLGAISYLGLASIFVLLIRYANVLLSLEGIFGIVVILVLNYLFVNKLLSKLKEEILSKDIVNSKTKETYKQYFIKIIPIIIAIITFCFAGWEPISSFGMIMFWGVVLIAVYNIIITNNLLKIRASK
ncbi:MAG: hypothetical protein V8R81_03000 [Clostridia bacterium]